ncbi:hypothetical protein O9993_11905 [Vibrio lentus]|nr:hypothetical protein [Vibrio lentus]
MVHTHSRNATIWAMFADAAFFGTTHTR